MDLPGQRSDPSCSCNLSWSCGNAGCLTCCARPGMEPVSECSQEATNPVAPQWELLSCLFNKCAACSLSSFSLPFFFFFFFFFFGCTHSVQKFLGSYLSQSSGLSCSSDNARSLITRLPWNSAQLWIGSLWTWSIYLIELYNYTGKSGDGKCAQVWKCKVEGELNFIFYSAKVIVLKTGEKEKRKKHIVI